MSDTQVPEPTGPAPVAPEPPAAPAPDAPKVFDAAYVEELRKEAAKHRTELRRLQAAAAEAEQAKLSDLERLQKKTAELEQHMATQRQALRQERARVAVLQEATALGLDAALAIELLTPDKLDYDDDDKPRGIKSALNALAARFPQLQASQARTANPARSGSVVETDDQRRARLFGSGAMNMFDPQVAAQFGGGVVNRTKE